MSIGETILGVVLEVVFDKLASQQVINLLQSPEVGESLVDKLNSLMSVVAINQKLIRLFLFINYD